MIVEVSLPVSSLELFSYEYRGDPDRIHEGVRVVVPLLNRFMTGWIVNTDSRYRGSVKPLIGIIRSDFRVDAKYMEFISAVSSEFLVSKGKLLDLCLSPRMKSNANIAFRTDTAERSLAKCSASDLFRLSRDREIDLFYRDELLTGAFPGEKKELIPENSPVHRLFLGYERTGFYRDESGNEISQGRSPLLIIPNNMSSGKYKNALPELQFYNSMQAQRERERLWELAVRGEPVFIGGGESALFLPVKNPGTIMLENPGSFFYDMNYSTGIDIRKASRIKSSIMGVNMVEGNASLTVYHQSRRDKIVFTDQRETSHPPISVNGISTGTRMIPEHIIDQVIGDYISGRKILVISGKKTSFRILLCEKCGSVFKCPSCGRSVTEQNGSSVKCSGCSYEKEFIPGCPSCSSELKTIEDIGLNSLKKKLIQRTGEEDILIFEKNKKSGSSPYKINGGSVPNRIILTAPAEVNSFPECSFNSIFFIKPESFFDLNNYNGGEQIFNYISGLRDVLAPGGRISVHSVFHFHYSLKQINDENAFLGRELKYREMFMLPPYHDLFTVEVREKDLRKLGGLM